jgi:hypothetical protein
MPSVERLRAAGAVFLGKNNLHEFAFCITTENPHYGDVSNPWDLSRIADGSSGGTAGAIASGVCPGRSPNLLPPTATRQSTSLARTAGSDQADKDHAQGTRSSSCRR